MKKVLLIISSLKKGGSERVLTILANEFVERGYQVTIVIFTSNEIAYPLHSAVKVVSLYRPHRSLSLLSRIGQLFRILTGIRKCSTSEKYNAIISFGQNTNIKVVLANLFLRNKIIVSDRNNPKYSTTRFRMFFRDIFYRLASCIVVQTKQIREEQYSHFKNVKVIYNPVTSHRIRSDVESKTLVTVGRLQPGKNHQFLILQLKDVLPDDWTFYIIGDGPKRESLQGLIDESGLNAKIKLLGKIDDVYEQIAAASLFVYASESEGYPNALIEAMSVGLPVVAANCKYGPAEIIEENVSGFLYDLNKPELFRQKVSMLIHNPSLRKRLSEAAVKIKERTNKDVIVGQWIDIIR